MKIFKKLEKREGIDKDFLEIIKHSTIAFILRIFGAFMSYGFTFIVTKLLGAKAWGFFSLSLVILQITSVFSRLGLDTALLRFIAQYNAQGKKEISKYIYLKSLKIVFFSSLIFSAILYFLSPMIAKKIFNKTYLTPYFRLVALGIIPFSLLLVNSESLRAFKKIKEYIIFQSLLPFLIASVFICFFIVLFKIQKPIIALFAYIVGIGFSTLLSSIIIQKEFGKTVNKEINVSLSYILSVSLPMLVSNSLFMIMSWIDTLMLGMWETPEEVGIYNVAVKLSTVTSFMLVTINSITAPKFAEFWGKGDLEGLKKIAQQSTRFIFWTSAPILVLFFIFPEVFLGMFGKEFMDKGDILRILILGQFINILSGSLGYLLNMTGNQNILYIIGFYTLILNAILNYFLIPKLGILGAALTTALNQWLASLSGIIYLYLKYGFTTIPRRLL